MSNNKKPDFSNVQGGVQSTEQVKPDFSNVESKVTSTEEILGGEGGGFIGMPIDVTFGGTRTVGTAAISGNTVTFTEGE